MRAELSPANGLSDMSKNQQLGDPGIMCKGFVQRGFEIYMHTCMNVDDLPDVSF